MNLPPPPPGAQGPPVASGTPTASPMASIADRGYRRYDGPRLGVRGATRSLFRHTVQRVLGLRRPARAKILPVLSALFAYLPAIVFVGITALVPDDRLRDFVLPTYGEYYGFVVSALVVFATFVAPEALCPDRRTGLLGMYLAAPLNRASYLLTKTAAIAAVLAIATVGPPVLLLVANVLQDQGPDGIGDLVVLAVRVLAAGVVVTLLYTAITVAVSSLTDRRAFASAAVLLLLVLSGSIAGILVEELDAPEGVGLVALNRVALDSVRVVYGEETGLEVPPPAIVGAWAAWCVLGLGLAAWRHRRFTVTR